MKRWIALLVLAACSAPPAPDPRSALTREMIDRSTRPLILAEIPAMSVAATLAPVAETGDVATWATGQDQSLTYRDGVLIATRGLGADLMSADVSGTLAALNGGPAQDYPRLLTYLDGQDGTLHRALLCSMARAGGAEVVSFGLSYQTSLWVETCHTTGQSIENRYWLDAEGQMRRSEQWIGPELGYLATERLTR